MNILILNPIIYTSETANIKRAHTIKDTMIYDLCLAFMQKGHNVTLAAAKDFMPTEKEEYPFEVIWLDTKLKRICKPNALPFCPKIKGIIKNRKFDLIISSEVFSLNSFMLARRCKDKLIVWHELAKHNNIMKKIPSRLWYNIVARVFFKDALIVPRSIEAKDFISKFCNNVCSTIIDHGVNLSKFELSTEKENCFCVSSQLIERKQIDKIINAFGKYLNKYNPSSKLYIMGDGEERGRLEALVSSLGIDGNVVFTGRLPHNELTDILKKSQAMLVYTRKDNNMVSIVESIACATPIITTSVPYNASYIESENLGIVNDNWNEDDLNKIASDKSFITNCISYRDTLSTRGKAELFCDIAKNELNISSSDINILLSSYSCNPYKGSEDGIGWHWTLELSKGFPNGTIYLVTKKANEADTRKGIEENELDNVRLIISDLPYCLNWYREHNSMFHHLYYIAWQRVAYHWAKKSKIKFDVVHHVTMNDFRITGCMHKLKQPYTIFGPVGGGQMTPPSLKEYDGGGILERVRSIVNNVVPSLPHFKRALNGFDKVYTINKETEALLPEKCKGNRLFELALADELKRLDIAERNNEPVRIMFMGRLIEKKGVILLLDIVKAMPKELNFELLIYGSGPLKDRIKEIISTDNLDNVKLVGAIEHSMISSAYRESDIFIMPSLRETSGNVLVEAMAHKLPIVALDMSICSDLKALDCGLFVNTEQGKDEIIGDFAKCLTRLVNDKSLRIRLGENGYNYVNDKLTWEQKFKEIYKDYI